jgi:hypothetical protein
MNPVGAFIADCPRHCDLPARLDSMAFREPSAIASGRPAKQLQSAGKPLRTAAV